MKRRDLLRHLEKYGCFLLREGGDHSIWKNTANNRRTTIPRHREISNYTAAAICKQLDIPLP
ncbi:MAG: type II toxin-antitoxin system HicA family toxin [Pyrinomonadaceae bacterium]